MAAKLGLQPAHRFNRVGVFATEQVIERRRRRTSNAEFNLAPKRNTNACASKGFIAHPVEPGGVQQVESHGRIRHQVGTRRGIREKEECRQPGNDQERRSHVPAACGHRAPHSRQARRRHGRGRG